MLDLSHLNAEQKEAVLHRGGPLLVLAGAGTGKTRVIVHRIAKLLEEGEAPDSILALTFTQKAAGEMRERIAALVGKKTARRLTMGTFHSFGSRLLRADAHRIGIPNQFSILDEGDQRAQVRRLLREAQLDERRAPAPDVIAAISLMKNGAGNAANLSGTEPGRAALQLCNKYDAHLRALGAVDFDDLILLPVRLLREVPDVAARVRNRFRHILVDEFQDTSSVQVDLLVETARRSRTICAVGDDDQAIYGWRGAVVAHILEFERWFPGAHVVKLTENYRSTGNILSAANAVIACNAKRRPKALRTTSPDGLPVRIILCNDEEHEVRAVVVPLAQAVRDGAKPERFAILFRTAAQSRPFEAALRLEGIPYVLVGGQDLTERREVKDVLAYAAMMAGRDDEMAFRRVVATPSRGVGPTSVEKVVAHARAQGIPLIHAAKSARTVPGLQKKAVAPLEELATILATVVETHQRASQGSDPTDVLRGLLKDSGYLASLEDDEDLVRAKRRVATVDLVLDSLSRLATRLHESLEVPNEETARVAVDEGSALDQLLDRMALDRDEPDRNDDRDDRPGVRLMSLHASKGLEFPVVYLPGWEEGQMPHKRSLADAAATPAPAVEEEGEEKSAEEAGQQARLSVVHSDGVEEERRLAYVGITRAREELIVTRAVARRKYGKLTPRDPSRFLGEMPPSVVTEDQTDRALTEEEQRQKAADMFRKLREQLGGVK
ncbi:MAG: UvrD-helicase domain-containing protein [Myxococcota bacterium]